MEENLEYQQARALLLEQVGALDTERIPLEQCGGRVLAEDIVAGEDIPPFDRSPYDGYAFRAADTAGASADAPAILRVLEEIPAGGVSHIPVTAGTAVRVMTGAPIPLGADAATANGQDIFLHQRLPAGNPEFIDAKGGCRRHRPDHFILGEHSRPGLFFNAVLRHAVPAAEIAPLCHR